MKKKEMTKEKIIWIVISLFFVWTLLPEIAQAQVTRQTCKGLVFSTEEDFVTRGPTPPDGNPIISDGDLLSMQNFPGPGVAVCMRNNDLLKVFKVRVDLGLDAVDIVDSEKGLVVFSTELDDPLGRFTAGDLLGTNGAIVPNQALLVRFDLPRGEDIGLDVVQFAGKDRAIIDLLNKIKDIGRDQFMENPKLLLELLQSLNVDIWFSTEGTGPFPNQPSFIDGDLLSARDGVIVVSNANFLPGLPAGIPNRGVDYGCDAFTIGHDPIENVRVNLFSTEIVSLEKINFTDGDVLQQGDGVFVNNFFLIHNLEPNAKDLGLDALDFVGVIPCEEQVRITHLWETKVADISIDGYAPKDIGSAPDPTIKDRPFGGWVKIIGDLPGTECIDVNKYEYLVEFKPEGGAWQPILTPDHDHPMNPNWLWEVPANWPPGTSFNYLSDGNGWITISDYWKTHDGFRSLIVWNTIGKEGKYRLRLTMREIGMPGTEIFSSEVPVFLDNTRPHDLATRPDIILKDSFTDQCDIPVDKRTIKITGEIIDEHFLLYTLHWHGDGGGLTSIVTHYYDEGLPFLGTLGTIPLGTFVDLGSVTIPTDIGCGFIRIRAQDRTIVGKFIPRIPGMIDLIYRDPDDWDSYEWESFCFRKEE